MIGSACAAAAVLVCIVLFVLCCKCLLITLYAVVSTHFFFLSVLYCCVLPGTRRKRMRLSVLYGPDNELTNLRAYARTQAAHNPHYTWYVPNYVYCMCMAMQILSKQQFGLKNSATIVCKTFQVSV